MATNSSEAITSIAALDEPARLALYRHIATQVEGVTRDQAARAVGIARSLAAYHLDRLAELGLLEVDYQRPSGKRGPGAGRPAKLYRSATRPVQVAFPPRNYELASKLLLEAVEAAGTSPPPVALAQAARAFGVRLGADARKRSGTRPSQRRLLESLEMELRDSGFEPARDGKRMLLRNCPFDALAREHQSTVCGMNLALMEGAIDGLGIGGLVPSLDPAPGRCCVLLGTARP